MHISKVTIKRFEKDENKKTIYNLKETETLILDADLVAPRFIGSIKFFRSLGGTETKTMSHTSYGYSLTKLVSTSPDKETKVIREFDYIKLTRVYGKRLNRLINIRSKVWYGNESKAGEVTIFNEPKKATKKQMTDIY